MSKKASILQYLEMVSPLLSIPFYWEDTNSILLGGNEATLKAAGTTREGYVGKSLFEIYPYEMAAHIKQHNNEVMRLGIALSQEEVIADVTTGEIKYFMATKSPMRDDEGNIIGIVGTSVDISAEKEAERLKIEFEKQNQSLREQEKFMKIANQVAHDIRSPLASLLMIVKSCTEIPEAERIALREAAISINDITNTLLSQFAPKNSDTSPEQQESQPMLVSAALFQLLADKKYEYQNTPIKLDHEFSQTGHFAFIQISISDFKRMISNLINNAKESFDEFGNKKAKIILGLDASHEWVTITIQDNGKGMAPDLINKIQQNLAVTEGKKTGYGLGLTQVRETLQRYQGEMNIVSELGKGTKITINFPRIKAPNWIGEEIKLGPEDIIIILDDDTSIHTAWDARLEPVLLNSPKIQIMHFHSGHHTLSFINSLTPEHKDKVFLLSDFELLKQDLNGLTVVEKSGVKRSLLVTSHYGNQAVLDQAAKIGTKILPKQLASEIPIQIDESIQYTQPETVDLVIVDDNKKFSDNLITFIFNEENVDCYQDPHHFLENVDKYGKNTKFLLDNNFDTSNLNGIQLAKALHAKGYQNLYLLSGDVFKTEELPDYLTAICKDDIASIVKLK